MDAGVRGGSSFTGVVKVLDEGGKGVEFGRCCVPTHAKETGQQNPPRYLNWGGRVALPSYEDFFRILTEVEG